MEKKYGFLKMDISEFISWINTQKIARTILYLQQHHTFIPDYDDFTGSNHFQLQQSMKNHHMNERGWRDIGQHFTIFPDGIVLTGRSLEYSAACIYGVNSNAICIENLGNFDLGGDQMNESQKDTILQVTAELANKFSVPVNTDKIIYHHWYNLETGERNNGNKNNKSCPGTNFFGGNKVNDAKKYFIPKVKSLLKEKTPNTASASIIKYVSTTASKLNVRVGPGTQFNKAKDRKSIDYGTVVRVYGENNGWHKISSSKDHWISARYTNDVERAVVIASALNLRKGPGMNYAIIGKLVKDQEVFIYQHKDNWSKITNQEKWVSTKYLKIG